MGRAQAHSMLGFILSSIHKARYRENPRPPRPFSYRRLLGRPDLRTPTAQLRDAMEFDDGTRGSKSSCAKDDGYIDRNHHLSSGDSQDSDCCYSEERKSGDRESVMEQINPSLSEQHCDDQKHGREVDVSFGPLPGHGSVPRPSLPVTTLFEGPATECLVLHNVFDEAVENSTEFYLEIKESIHEKCAKFGPVFHIHVDENLGFVYLRFNSKRASRSAQEAFHNSVFEGRVITSTFMSNSLYDTMFPDYWTELLG